MPDCREQARSYANHNESTRMTDEILFRVRNHVGHVTLNRPAALNALSYPMIVALRDQLRRWADNGDVHAVMLRGAGGKAFCAGGDVRALYDSFKAGTAAHTQFFADEYVLDYSIHRYPKPCVALMDGIVMGGGMGIAQGAWLRIATDRTRLAMPEVGIGLFPDVGGSFFLNRAPGALGLYLGVAGVQIRAADVLYARLGDTYLHHDHVNDLDRLLDSLTWSSDHHTDLTRALEAAGSGPLQGAPLAHLQIVIDRHFCRDSVPEIIASLESESSPEHVGWAKETLNILAKRSPTMMCATFEQIRRGRTMTLADCFRMELGMVHQCFRQGDFVEGIRALIVDKDMQPRWSPAMIEDVTAESVARFFADCWAKNNHPLGTLGSMDQDRINRGIH